MGRPLREERTDDGQKKDQRKAKEFQLHELEVRVRVTPPLGHGR